ncbi:MAG: RseA family anti-sigma factor [Pseudomonadota bacterium]
MTEIDEKLSYLLDDYSDEASDAALDEVVSDVNLQYSMRRYQMIGEVMRHELPQSINPDFHSEVMAKIRADLPATSKPETAPAKEAVASSLLSWIGLKPIAGLAVAASVAIVTVSLWQPVNQQNNPGTQDIVSADQQKVDQLAGRKLSGTAVPASLGMRWKVKKDTPALQQKLNGYLVNHTEYSNSMQGLIPQARVAGFDAEKK